MFFSPVPPNIITQPPDQTSVVPGTDITITVVATGSDLNFQWLKNGESLTEGSKYSGTMKATLTVIGVMESDGGGYLCIVGNAVRTLLSMTAVLTTTCKYIKEDS